MQWVPGYAALHPGYYDIDNKKRRPLGPPFFHVIVHVISIASSPAIAADHGAHGLVGSEILGAIDIEQR
jgi:hypothetical protein